jgi:hypothetical protein
LITRRLALASLCAVAACSTSQSLSNRPLGAGVSRTFAGDFETVNAVNILRPFNVRGARVVRFDKPLDSTSWGESGRVVVWPSVVNTTRVTVAVDARDVSQPSVFVEREYARQIFEQVEAQLAPGAAQPPASGL